MCDLKACRICLRNESKFYRIDEFNLKLYYEEATSLPASEKDGIPQYFCFECAALLYKFHRFREKCYDGQRVFRDMLCSGPITYAGISELNMRKIHKCQYGILDFLDESKHVKTYHIQHTKDLKIENDNFKEESFDVEYSDAPFTDEDDFDCKDPENDPVAEENVVNLILMKPEEIIVNEKAEIPEAANDSSVHIDQMKLVGKEIEMDEPQMPVEKKTKVKRKKIQQTGRTKRTNKKYTKRKQRSELDIMDSDSSDEILINIKSRKKMSVISPDTAKSYKFNKPHSTKLRSLAFLDSGFWKKSSLSEEEAVKNFEAKAEDRKYLNAAFKCTDCYKGFSQSNMLDRHVSQRHGEAAGKLVCRFCKMRFKSTHYINKHMRQHYTTYECLRCDLVCTLENTALFHEEYHNGVVRMCPHCDREFKHLSTFYTHLRTHRSKHICALCGESFVSELGLRLHRKAKHTADGETPVKMSENIYCDICQMKFETFEAYDKHLNHSALHTDLNKISDDNIVMNVFQDEKGDNDNLCEEDHETTTELHKRRSRVEKTLSAVRKSHLPRRTSKKPSTCHHCGKHFESQSACMKHHLAMHPRTSFFSPKDRVICEVCGASLAPGSVSAHLNQHTRSKIYTCDTCGRSFTTSTMLRTHLVTHTGEKRFACSLCDKRFTQNGSLSLHYRTFHLKQPYPKRNRRKKIDQPNMENFDGKEE